MMYGIAIVKPTANKSSCNSFRNRKKQISTDMAKVTNVIKTTRNVDLCIICIKAVIQAMTLDN